MPTRGEEQDRQRELQALDQIASALQRQAEAMVRISRYLARADARATGAAEPDELPESADNNSD